MSPGWVQVPLLNSLHTPGGYFGFSFAFPELEPWSLFFLETVLLVFAERDTFFRTSKADHFVETSCADMKYLSSSQA